MKALKEDMDVLVDVLKVDYIEESLSKMCTVQQMQTEVEKLRAETTCLKQQFPTEQVDKKLGESMRKERDRQ